MCKFRQNTSAALLARNMGWVSVGQEGICWAGGYCQTLLPSSHWITRLQSSLMWASTVFRNHIQWSYHFSSPQFWISFCPVLFSCILPWERLHIFLHTDYKMKGYEINICLQQLFSLTMHHHINLKPKSIIIHLEKTLTMLSKRKYFCLHGFLM